MTDHQFAYLTSTTHPGFLNAPPLTGRPSADVVVAGIGEELHDLNWVGMDLCEVAPAYDHAELTSNAAATLVWTYLCGRMAPRRS